jgi:hypothetical protein
MIEAVIRGTCDACSCHRDIILKDLDCPRTSAKVDPLAAHAYLRAHGWTFQMQFGEPPHYERKYKSLCKRCSLEMKNAKQSTSGDVAEHP